MHNNHPPHVVITVPCSAMIQEHLLAQFGTQCHFTFTDSFTHISEKVLPSVHVVIGEPEEKDILKMPDLKWIQLTWAGANKYRCMQHLPERLTITNASGAFGTIISEYVIGTIIALYRSFPTYWHNQHQHLWQPSNSSETIYGKTVLILGTGDLGTQLAHRLKAFDTHIIGIRRHVTRHFLSDFDEIYDLSQLDAQLEKADIVVGCLPDTPKTAGLLHKERLCKMKKNALLINVGRGSLIPTSDLTDVLKEGHLKGAALDVTDVEPLPEASPLWDMPNVILTPHIAGPSFGGNKDVEKAIWSICVDNLERFLFGQPLTHIVNLKEGY